VVAVRVATPPADVDGKRMTLRIEQGKGAQDRYAMLSPVLLQRLRTWSSRIRSASWMRMRIAQISFSRSSDELALDRRIPKASCAVVIDCSMTNPPT